MDNKEQAPRVEACIAAVMERFPGASEKADARYFQAVHQELAPLARKLESDLTRIYDAFGVGSKAREIHTLMVSVSNVLSFADKLHAIEREFFMVPGDPAGCEPDEEPQDECLVNSWNTNTEQYVEQFRAALAKIATSPDPAVVQMTDEQPSDLAAAILALPFPAHGYGQMSSDDIFRSALTAAAALASQPAAQEQDKALYEKAIVLLNHLEDVLDDENFAKIDSKLWNAVTMHYVAQLAQSADKAEG